MSSLTKRDGAPDQDGLHIAGTDGRFSESVEGEHARCTNPDCRALLPQASEDQLCYACERMLDQMDEEARKRARWSP